MAAKDSEMVDRVAKAAANAYYGEDCWDSLTEEVFDQWLAVARAAIEAMREPTVAMKMVSQGVFMNPANGYKLEDSDWTRIIDAALTPSL